MKKKTNEIIIKVKKSNTGITLIALVITILVLLILAGVTISVLTGNNGILNRAALSKVETDKAQEKEKIQLAVKAAKIKDNYGPIQESDLEKELNTNLGNEEYILRNTADGFRITVLDSNRLYLVDKNENVILLGDAILTPELKILKNTGRTITVGVDGEEKEKYSYQFSTDGTTWNNSSDDTYTINAIGKTASYNVPEIGLDDMDDPIITGQSENKTIYLKSKNNNTDEENISSIKVTAATIIEGGNPEYFTYTDLGDEILITGYSNKAFDWSKRSDVKERIKNIEEDDKWKIVIPSFINEKPVTKISEDFLDQNLTKPSLVFGDNTEFTSYISAIKYKEGLRTEARVFCNNSEFLYSNGTYEMRPTKYWDYSVKYYDFLWNYGNLYDCKEEQTSSNYENKISFNPKIIPTEVIIPSSISELHIENSYSDNKIVLYRKSAKINNYMYPRIDLDIDIDPIPIRPSGGIEINFDEIQNSNKCKFIFVDRNNTGDIKNHETIEGKKINLNLNLEYKNFNN